MKNITIDKTTTYIFFILFASLILSTFGFLSISNQLLGAISITLTVLLFSIIIKHQGLSATPIKMFFPYILFVIIYIVNYTAYPTSSAINNIVFYITYGIFLFNTSRITWKKFHIKTFALLSWIFLPLILLLTITEYEGINSNRIAAFAYILWFFPFLSIIDGSKRFKKFKVLLLCLFVGTIIFSTGARSILLSVAFMLLTFFMWNTISKNKLFFKLYFLFITVFICSYTVIYPQLNIILSNFSSLQEWMIEYTGKSIFSGREYIWLTLIDKIEQSPLLGYGSGALSSEFIGTNLSAHNLYLEIALQVGLIGLLFFALFLFNIWNIFWINRQNKRVKLSACFFIGILIHQINEVMLIKATVSLNLLMWLVIGVGLSYCFNSKNNP